MEKRACFCLYEVRFRLTAGAQAVRLALCGSDTPCGGVALRQCLADSAQPPQGTSSLDPIRLKTSVLLVYPSFIFGEGGHVMAYTVLPPYGGETQAVRLALRGGVYALRRELPYSNGLRAPPCSRKGLPPLTRCCASRPACFVGVGYTRGDVALRQ